VLRSGEERAEVGNRVGAEELHETEDRVPILELTGLAEER
jgi:hypothetical protein